MHNIKDIFEEDGILSKNNKFYKKRPSQIEAATEMEFAIRNNQHFVLEGPTGFGKSISYLVPSIKNLIENSFDGKIVVVTSNISLQDQLYSKDIPYILDIMQELYPKVKVRNKIKPVLLKGIGNFICMDKMESDEFLNSADLFNSSTMQEVKKFYATTKDGDLTKAPFILSSEDSKKVVCLTSNECKGSLCPEKLDCFYNKQKNNVKSSKLVVTNYHMLFSCITSGSQLFSDTTTFIFDEAHEAESILRNFLAESINSGTVEYIERKITEIKNAAVKCSYDNEIKIDIEGLKNASNDYFTQAESMHIDVLMSSPMLISSQNDLPDPSNFIIQLKKVMSELKRISVSLDADFKEINENHTSESEESSQKAGLASVVDSLSKTCKNTIEMIEGVDNTLKDDNLVMYIERERNRIIIGRTEIDVSNRFKSYFLEDCEVSCILTSATISVGGNLEYFKNKLGLNKVDDRVMEYIGVTPFNLKEQELWYVPQNALPGNNKNFDSFIPNQVEEIIRATNGGALCLFTSNKNLKLTKEHLYNALPEHNILSQGERSRFVLLEEFKDDINSTLLATKSFFTGVDVSGESLRVVVIDKLPFSVPTDPIHQKLSSKRGYFVEHMLPEMIVAFKQAVGRGVRSIDDKCIICVLDERIISANYAPKILRSLPYEKTLTRDVSSFEEFLSVKVNNN